VRSFAGWEINDRVETPDGIGTIFNIMIPEADEGRPIKRAARARVQFETGGCGIVAIADLSEPDYAAVGADADDCDGSEPECVGAAGIASQSAD